MIKNKVLGHLNYMIFKKLVISTIRLIPVKHLVHHPIIFIALVYLKLIIRINSMKKKNQSKMKTTEIESNHSNNN